MLNKCLLLSANIRLSTNEILSIKQAHLFPFHLFSVPIDRKIFFSISGLPLSNKKKLQASSILSIPCQLATRARLPSFFLETKNLPTSKGSLPKKRFPISCVKQEKIEFDADIWSKTIKIVMAVFRQWMLIALLKVYCLLN